MDNLVKRRVSHHTFGDGIIVDANGDRVIVDFKGRVRIFRLPDAFTEGYLQIGEDIGFQVPSDGEIRTKGGIKDDIKTNDAEYYRKRYRADFKKWIEDYYNATSERKINDATGYASDVFFIEKYCPDKEFLEWFRTEESLEKARKEMLTLPRIINGQQKPEKRVDGYIRRMRIFREYLHYIGKI